MIVNDEQKAALSELFRVAKRRRSNYAASDIMSDQERKWAGMNETAKSDYADYVNAEKRCRDLGIDLLGYDLP